VTTGEAVQGRCQVCGVETDIGVVPVPFAPVSLLKKCDGCRGTVTLEEVAFLFQVATRRFDERLRTLVPTLALPVHFEGDTVDCFRILLSEPLPRSLEHARWARPGARAVADHIDHGTPIDLEEVAEACRAELAAMPPPAWMRRLRRTRHGGGPTTPQDDQV
jgi:hypothetical protein